MHRLKLLGTVSVLALALNTGAAHAATYSVSNEAELTAAIASANADGDASSTITLTDSFAIVGTGLPPVTKTLTIDTGAHRLTSTTNANWNVADGVNLTLTGDMIANPGRFVKDGDGTQILSGFNATSSNALQVEAGTLRIEGGSRLQGGSVGSDPALRVTGNSTLILSGAGTRFTTNLGAASSFLGGTGNGASFIIQDGAEYLTTRGLLIADTTNSTGTLHVTGTNSLFNGAAMYVRVGTGRVNIDAGGVIRSS